MRKIFIVILVLTGFIFTACTKPEEREFTISLNGESNISLNQGDIYNEEGAKANDSIDGEVIANVYKIEFNGSLETSVDTSKVGTYTITYRAINSEGVTKTIVRTLVIKQKEVTRTFTLTLNGNSTIKVNQNSTYIDQGANATDSIDGNVVVTSKITFGGANVTNIDTSEIGIYIITYTATNSNNETKSITRSVEVVAVTVQNNTEYITVSDNRINQVINVTTTNDIKAKVSHLNAGDALVLEDGTYNDLVIELKKDGTKLAPIFLIAKNPGKVQITGNSKIKVTGDYNVVAGLIFTNGHPTDDKGVIELRGSHNRLNNNKILDFENKSCGTDVCDKWVSVYGTYNEIDHNHFEGKTTSGALLTVWREVGKADYHHIHHNYFKDYTNPNNISNGLEAIRIGTSTESQSDSYTVVEHNIFENMDGEVELISIKSGRNEIRGNLIKNSASLITSRHGKNNIIENNIFLQGNKSNTGGIRVYDGGHIIRNNYIEGVNTSSNTRGGIVIHSGINEPNTETTLNKQWTSYDITVENNTIIGSRQSVQFDDKYDFGPKNIEFINNFIYSTNYDLFRYDTAGLTNTFENTISFNNNDFYGGKSLNGGNGDMNIFGITLKNSTPTLTVKDGLSYYNGESGAKNLEVISTNKVGNNY